MLMDNTCSARARLPTDPRTLICTKEAVWLWPGIALTEKRGGRLWPSSEAEILQSAARLYGPDVNNSRLVSTIRVAAELIDKGLVEHAQRALDRLGLSKVSPDGAALVSAVSYRLDIEAPTLLAGPGPRRLSEIDIEYFARGYDGIAARAEWLQKEWDPDKHPRLGGPPNAGWFATAGNIAPTRNLPISSPQIVDIADFSDGFHDVVVDLWVDALRKDGWQVVKNLPVRLIGPDTRVIGYPDILARDPDGVWHLFEIKTGANPPLTNRQSQYLPAVQIGGHIYSTDERVTTLGIPVATPFPPLHVGIIYAPGPGQKYQFIEPPEPEFGPPK